MERKRISRLEAWSSHNAGGNGYEENSTHYRCHSVRYRAGARSRTGPRPERTDPAAKGYAAEQPAEGYRNPEDRAERPAPGDQCAELARRQEAHGSKLE